MQELINRLTKQIGLSDAQAKQVISIISEFIGEKHPMLKGQISNLLGSHEGGKDSPQVDGINLQGLG